MFYESQLRSPSLHTQHLSHRGYPKFCFFPFQELASLNSSQAPSAPAIAFVRAYNLQVSGCPQPPQSNQLSMLDL